jgi:hypothetical protein
MVGLMIHVVEELQCSEDNDCLALMIPRDRGA